MYCMPSQSIMIRVIAPVISPIEYIFIFIFAHAYFLLTFGLLVKNVNK
jgi:hypothetical protein